MEKKRYEELDALRGLAAILVVLFHFTMSRSEVANLGFKLGTTGVDLFFMISGFVILLSLEHVKKSSHFIINRISRLYPTYWACVTTTFAFIIIYGFYKMDFSAVSIVQYLGNMTMFQFYLDIPNLEGPYWTMIIEMLFYILMIVLFHFKLLKHLNKIGVVLTILFSLLANLFYEFPWVEELFIMIPLLQFWPLFFAGILFYKLISRDVNHAKYYGMILLCIVSQVSLFEYAGRSNASINVGEYAIMLGLYFSLLTLFVNGKLKFIINKPSLFLGKISFALYLIHQKVSVDYIIPILVYKLNVNLWIAFSVALICTIVLATAITYLIEVPYSRKMRNKLYSRFSKSN